MEQKNGKDFVRQKEISSKDLEQIINSGYIPTKEDYEENPALKNYYFSLIASFKKDPSIITLFPRQLLTEVNAYSALERGYQPTLLDLRKNEELTNCRPIMERLIHLEPKCIVYTGSRCDLSNNCIKYAKEHYTLTNKDFYNHMQLCYNTPLLENLGEDYYLYDFVLSIQKKIEVVRDCLLKKDFERLKNLPFFDIRFGSALTPTEILKIVGLFWLNLDENKVAEQEEYAQIIDKIIDGIIIIRYQKAKDTFLYSSIDVLDKDVKNVFQATKEKKQIELLKDFCNRLFNFVGEEEITYSAIEEQIMEFYGQFLKNNDLSYEETTPFYNMILNQHRNRFYKEEKERIISDLKKKLPLTKRKQQYLTADSALKQVSQSLKEKNYEILKTNRKELVKFCLQARKEILQSKEYRKENIEIPESIFIQFETIFLEKGALTIEDISKLFPTKYPKLTRLISNKYNRICLNFIDSFPCDFSFEVENIPFHYNNFVMGDANLYATVLATTLVQMNRDLYKQIMSNTEVSEIKKLFPFVSLFPEFEQKNLFTLLCHYNKVKEKLISSRKEYASYRLLFLSNFSDVLTLSLGYDTCNHLVTTILGEEMVQKLGEYPAKMYLEVYKNMLNRTKGSIPPLKGTFENIVYESGNYTDKTRLLIGKNIAFSCVDLGQAGKMAYHECLEEETGDVLIIRDKNTNEFLGRMLLFRRGNLVQFAPLYQKNGTIYKISFSFFLTLAQSIIKQAKEIGDTIEYVFLTSMSVLNNPPAHKYFSAEFEYAFPHADLKPNAYLISENTPYTNEELLAKLDFHTTPKSLYQRARDKVVEEVNDLKLTRIRALRIEQEENSTLKQQWIKNFEPFYQKLYQKVIAGENWYIALKEDNTTEEVFVKTKDPRAYEEFLQAKEKILSTSFQKKFPK